MDPKTIAAQRMAQMIEDEIKRFVRESPLNRMPDDTISLSLKSPWSGSPTAMTRFSPNSRRSSGRIHLTPIEALVKAYNKQPEDKCKLVSVISWVLPVAKNVRESNREETAVPSRYWAYTKWYARNSTTPCANTS